MVQAGPLAQNESAQNTEYQRTCSKKQQELGNMRQIQIGGNKGCSIIKDVGQVQTLRKICGNGFYGRFDIHKESPFGKRK